MPTKQRAFGSRHELEKIRPTLKRTFAARKLVRPKVSPECKEPCVMSAFQAWHDANLTPAWNYMLSFTLPAGKRLVIELVTAIADRIVGCLPMWLISEPDRIVTRHRVPPLRQNRVICKDSRIVHRKSSCDVPVI
jgi:hypothetical protein